jgi:hypothetical protein
MSETPILRHASRGITLLQINMDNGSVDFSRNFAYLPACGASNAAVRIPLKSSHLCNQAACLDGPPQAIGAPFALITCASKGGYARERKVAANVIHSQKVSYHCLDAVGLRGSLLAVFFRCGSRVA